MKKTISIITPCYNEEANVRELYTRVRSVIAGLGCYHYEHIFIDNASRDSTAEILRDIARSDKNVKVIRNTRNFGQIRSPMHALYQTTGEAVIGLSCDLQDPPEMIAEMLRTWESGIPVVIAVSNSSDEGGIMFRIRQTYYWLIKRLADVETYDHFTGFGLFDRKVVDMIKQFRDPYPYFRGMVAEIGLPHAELPYHKPQRKRGVTKNNVYTLYDLAMLGVTSLSKVPLRIMVFAGFVSAILCIVVAVLYFAYKLLFWSQFSVGTAPLLIGVFFLLSIQMVFLGLLGEYIGSIHTLIQNRPFVFELERLNFEFGPGEPLSEPPSCAAAAGAVGGGEA